MAWAKAAILVEAIVAYFQKEGSSIEQRGAFVREFKNWGGQVDYANNRRQVYKYMLHSLLV